ncbi:mortality factor 4-like protein 1 [Nematocida ausubeli]|nr:mortality factor 4-like protein 1 [Nematocida ausubeli]
MFNEKTAKTILTEGKKVLITTNAQKEIGIILEKKEKATESANTITIYKVKTAAGLIKWVSLAALETLDTSIMSEETDLEIVWPKITLSSAFQELLVQEKETMPLYKEPPAVNLSADEIFTMFYNSEVYIKQQSVEEIKEILKGFKEVFLYCVHTCILYKEERAFYEEYLYPKTTKILQTYGLTHILRMLLIMRRVQPTLNLSREHMEYMGECIRSFLFFLQMHESSLLDSIKENRDPQDTTPENDVPCATSSDTRHD